MFRFLASVLVLSVLWPQGVALGGDESSPVPPLALMPRVEDHTQIWWADGFPTHTPAARWLRVIQTGRYAMVLDTQTLRIPHFGAVSGIAHQWQGLPAAELALQITANGKSYHCTAGGKWTRWSGPRLIESGRFFQRADVTNLEFTADDGARLQVEARFETAAWPDRLSLTLAARPQSDAAVPASPEAPAVNPAESWQNAAMEIRLTNSEGALQQRWELAQGQTWTAAQWREVSLALDPVTFQAVSERSAVSVEALEIPNGAPRAVTYDATPGWHRVNLDGVQPIAARGGGERSNDALERVKLVLANPTDDEQLARLMFEKTAGGIKQRIGSPITGVSAILRDAHGEPTGIPVQLSKNWHNEPDGGVYRGQWFHGISQVRLPPGAKVELELTLAYGHWGGVPAASHAQLCLIGWGSNQLWDESALGAWGESICYDPDQIQANSTITDVRPLMVRSMHTGQPWGWTVNVGGGDFFRLFDVTGKRVGHTTVRTTYHRHGPCLTEVTYAARSGPSITHATTVSLARSDDVVRGVYRLRVDVNKATDFSRLVIFQVGCDTYNYSRERQFALGNETGLLKEWEAQWGGNRYRTAPVELTGRAAWASLHAAAPSQKDERSAWANRGIVLRAWKARLGGQDASPWIAEHGLTLHRTDSSTLDIVPPPGVTRLEAGDFVEATIEHVAVPQFAEDYYGPSAALRSALAQDENTWRMIYREAKGNDRRVEMKTGSLRRTQPAITVDVVNDAAEFTLTGGLGYVPLTFAGLTSPSGYTLWMDDEPVNQSIHGNDFWQTDFDPATQRWSQTFNVPINDAQPHTLRFSRQENAVPR
jgi:hypothetical protein